MNIVAHRCFARSNASRGPRINRLTMFAVIGLVVGVVLGGASPMGYASEFRLATFSADVTIPLGHRCMGILPTKASEVVDPLHVHGFVLLGGERPVVLAAFDWCEIRNDSFDAWRTTLAEAAGTTPERVLVSSLHQHDAPVIDGGAQRLLDEA
ncbi:MAG: hypothetical protein KDA71_18540, partial [Planctomycetales bacterium]|nr:hypothetical protein [Planctomycetales bacterium]